MKAEERFLKQDRKFWAYVRSISQEVGYTAKRKKQILIPTMSQICKAMTELGLSYSEIVDDNDHPTNLGLTLCAYFQYRADILNNEVENLLMTAGTAEKLYDKLKTTTNSTRKPVMNKQKGDMKKPAFLTSMVNMLVEKEVGKNGFDPDPRVLTTFTKNNIPLRTMARRVDGAYPSTINPIAIWEIKEYYYTTTFGSRVADGVYETLLDGMELEDLRESEKIPCKHYLILDAHYTWWECGRSYLCRIIDMLHMGYVDEVIFGKEVETRLPVIAKEWIEINNSKNK